MLIGFLSSALANRLAFVVWSLVAGAAYAACLRHGFQTETRARRRFALPCLALGLALMAHGALNSWFGPELDLAFRAFLPNLHHPLLTRPVTAVALGIGLGIWAVVLTYRSQNVPRRFL